MKDNLENEIDALFVLPLADFTGARNALAARLKKDGRADDAERVKSLRKPPVSAWVVNQLYWRHREAFDRLLATGDQFRKAQASLSLFRDSLHLAGSGLHWLAHRIRPRSLAAHALPLYRGIARRYCRRIRAADSHDAVA